MLFGGKGEGTGMGHRKIVVMGGEEMKGTEAEKMKGRTGGKGLEKLHTLFLKCSPVTEVQHLYLSLLSTSYW